MNINTKGNSQTSANDANLGRSQMVFIVVGMAIVVGGLWLLYQGDGPYHPEIPIDAKQETQDR